MENYRLNAVAKALSHETKEVIYPSEKISDYFAINTFNEISIQEFLPTDIFQQLKEDIENGKELDSKTVEQIATSLKAWAIKNGATHYTHWFQPLTGSTAEKHDAFISFDTHGKAIEMFKGNQLIQAEPDASSLPSGGIRNTFEARGYTAWDPTSPAFIMNNVVQIPSVFVSYTGDALDFKTPLLKSINVINNAAVDVVKYFDRNCTKVSPTLGWEQEYFLVDSALFNARPDLALTGRTVFGHSSAKDQQLEDHYFGIIPERVSAFMKEFEIEAYKLGIPVKTRHNEVAPNQFECAPIFEEANIAIDHNQMIMDLIEKIANKHNFNALLHEKPFAGINGSGKHNNWSLETNSGINLLSPGKTSKSNFRFLTFIINIIKAVHDNSDLLRACIASAGNDHRLGGNEAPPAIISVFMGSHLTRVLNEIENSDDPKSTLNHVGQELRLNIEKIPEILLDNTDRNRTSPFAFTGNKFEFRAVGSSANCSAAVTVLNLIIANQLQMFKADVDALIAKKVKKNQALIQVLRKCIIESKKIRFEGNNYGEEWIREAKKRGLSNIQSTPDALKSFLTKKTTKLFEENNVLSEKEIKARYEIQLEAYTKKLQIESRVIGDLAGNHIIPTAIKYQNTLIENVNGLKTVLDNGSFEKVSKNQKESILKIAEHIVEIQNGINNMLEQRKIANRKPNVEEKATAYMNNVLPFFDEIRMHVDKLELMVDNELWTLPKYRELLFIN